MYSVQSAPNMFLLGPVVWGHALQENFKTALLRLNLE